ncbi:DUF1819 family protein [Bacillus anthracis]|uniref:BrxA family protein n=1 Tax=Bacillus TaxID=1386 RepID=UPI0008FE70E9|nr:MULTISPECIES: BrxA family protein [Bacillus]MBL3852435.1 DUF1819 family protein [Bacillus cereus]MDR4410057.1 DUF1819 family protein [Bacillus anthracis]OJE21765.1 hypothetical protein BAQ46_20725 [Bacillus paranthracis]TSI15282.1 DUF1819 family protein [Bacillus sp. HY001]
MEDFNNTRELGVYDTAINVIGGLRDITVIFKAIDSHFSQSDSLEELVNQRNEFNLRTEKSRTRIEREIRKGFLQFKNEDHQELIKGIFSERVPLRDKELILVWQFALNNRLFREITSRVFVKTFYSGRTSISKDDIGAYLKEFLLQNESQQISWSENTINTLSTKYLNLMSKFGFLSSERVKSYKHIRPSSEAQVLFLYFAKLFSPSTSNILTNELLPISFISSEDIQNRLKKLSLKGFFNMNFNGVALNIELTQSYKGVCDVLYN